MIFLLTLRNALCAALLAAPFAYVFSLPWVDLGVWRQTETATVVLHMLSGLTALFLGASAAIGSRRARLALIHPVVLSFAALAAYTFVQALVDPLDGFDAPRTLHGLLKHGVGGLWHLDVAVLMAGYLATSRGGWRTIYALNMLAAAAVAILLTALFLDKGDNPWVPYDFPGWIGILSLLVIASGLATRDRRVIKIALVIGAAGLIVGHNSTADFAALLAGLAYGAWKLMPPSRRPTGAGLRNGVLAASVTAVIAIAAALPLLTSTLESIAVSGVNPAAAKLDGIPSTDLRDHVAIDLKPYGTVWSRGWMVKSVFSNLAAHPQALIFGRGWGSFPEVYAEEMRAVPGRFFTQPTETSSRTFADPRKKADFHSHNMLAETLLSLGIPGAILFLLAMTAPLMYARGRDVPAAAFLVGTFCIVTSMWFLVNTLAAFVAFAFVSVIRLDMSYRPKSRLVAPASALACVAAGLSLFFFSSILFGVAIAERQARYFAPVEDVTCKAISGYLAPAREINATLYRRFVEFGQSQKVPFAWFAGRAKNAVNYACLIRDLSEHNSDAALLDTSLDVRFQLLTSSGNFPVLLTWLKVDIDRWADDIKKLLTLAPDRSDVIIPYVSWLILKGDTPGALDAMAKLSPLVMNTDPVSNWLAARKAELEGDEKTYKDQMVLALRGGIANLVRLRKADTDVFFAPGPVAIPPRTTSAAPPQGIPQPGAGIPGIGIPGMPDLAQPTLPRTPRSAAPSAPTAGASQ